MTRWRARHQAVRMAGMRETADERVYADLVRVVREQRRRRDLGYVEPGPSAEEPGGGTEQDPQPEE